MASAVKSGQAEVITTRVFGQLLTISMQSANELTSDSSLSNRIAAKSSVFTSRRTASPEETTVTAKPAHLRRAFNALATNKSYSATMTFGPVVC